MPGSTVLPSTNIVIVGAGVIGSAVALTLLRDGHRVTLLDREAPAAGASFGNSGAIVNGSCAPTAMPGVWKQGLRSLTDPLAPFSVRPAYLPRALPWLAGFLAASRPSRVDAIAASLHALSRHAADAWLRLVKGTAMAKHLHAGGWLKLYETAEGFAATAASRALLDANGVPYEILDADEIRSLEPELAPIFASGLLQKDALCIDDPGRLVEAMVEAFRAGGGRYLRFDVATVAAQASGVRVLGSGDTIVADKAVIAAGARSGPLAAALGSRVPLDTERGYHLMLPAGSEHLLGRAVMHGERFFVLSPMRQGLRMTSQVEIAGLDAQPDYRRIRSLLPEAKRLLPALDASERSVWMGCRPSLPDSLPVIGPAAKSPDVIFAFGHQHLGMTLAAISAELVADLVAGRAPAVDPEPYRADRFRG